jgi:hypothetical protein
MVVSPWYARLYGIAVPLCRTHTVRQRHEPPDCLRCVPLEVVVDERHDRHPLPPTILQRKLIKIGAKVVAHAKYLTSQLAEVADPGKLFARILERIARLSPACASR